MFNCLIVLCLPEKQPDQFHKLPTPATQAAQWSATISISALLW